MSDTEQCAIADLINQVNEIEQQLLEANAKIDELKAKLSDAETVGEKWLALHDAEIIDGLVDEFMCVIHDSEADAINVCFVEDMLSKARQLRNSAKEGEI